MGSLRRDIDPANRCLRWAGRVCLVVLLAVAGGQGALAALVTLPGWNFDVVYDDTQAGLGTFGAPVLSGNTIFFVPTTFAAQSSNGQGLISTSASVTFDLVAKPTIAFNELFLTERGDYRLSGAGSWVSVTGSMAATRPSVGTDSAPLALSASMPLTINDGELHPWQGSASLLTGTGTPLGPTPAFLTMTLSSTLSAFTPQGSNPSFAFIQQKFAGELVELQVRPSGEVAAVPAPASVYLLGLGLAVLGLTVRRKRGSAAPTF